MVRCPRKCAAILAAILDSYQHWLHDKYQSISNDALQLLLQERETLHKELTQWEQAYREFLDESPFLVKGKDGADVRQERLNSIQSKRSALLLRRVEIEGQLAAFDAARKEGRSNDTLLAMLAEFSNKADVDDPRKDRGLALQDQLLPLLMEEQKLLETRGDNHPEVLTVRKRIQAARDLMTRPAAAWSDPTGSPDIPVSERVEIQARHLQAPGTDGSVGGIICQALSGRTGRSQEDGHV